MSRVAVSKANYMTRAEYDGKRYAAIQADPVRKAAYLERKRREASIRQRDTASETLRKRAWRLANPDAAKRIRQAGHACGARPEIGQATKSSGVLELRNGPATDRGPPSQRLCAGKLARSRVALPPMSQSCGQSDAGVIANKGVEWHRRHGGWKWRFTELLTQA